MRIATTGRLVEKKGIEYGIRAITKLAPVYQNIWKNNNISVICQGLDSLEPIEREVLLIRLANELEEYQDLGLLYCPKAKQKRYRERHHQIVEMAEKLGFPLLASEFKKAEVEMASATIVQELCYCDEKKVSFFIPSPRQKSTLTKIKEAIFDRLKKLIPHYLSKREL